MGHNRFDSELPYLHIREDLEVPRMKTKHSDFFGPRSGKQTDDHLGLSSKLS